MKVCSTCKLKKDFEFFTLRKSSKDGYCSQCKECVAKYRSINKEKRLEYNRQWLSNNPDYYKKYRKKNYESVRNNELRYLKNNPQKREETLNKYVNSNREIINIRNLQWMKNNPGKVNAITAKRRSKKLLATPEWLSTEMLQEIADIYILSKQKELETGIKHHVDHIVPLQGIDVCGLHVPWNLQVITAEENQKKGNKYE